jgi:hypothetical protein
MILITTAECREFGNRQSMKANSSLAVPVSISIRLGFRSLSSPWTSILSSLSPLPSLELWVPGAYLEQNVCLKETHHL